MRRWHLLARHKRPSKTDQVPPICLKKQLTATVAASQFVIGSKPSRPVAFSRTKDLVRSDTIIDEDRIVGRDDQLGRVVDNLKPVLQNEGIPDMLLSGPSGTGKSLIIHAVCKQIVELCESQDKT